jgi:hypothetical protein
MVHFLVVNQILELPRNPVCSHGRAGKRGIFYLRMNKNLRIAIPLIFITSFIFIYPAFTNTPLKNFQIPSQFGTIKEVFEAPNGLTSNPIIIQIQDAHCNYEAQKNLAAILDYLAREKKLRLIMVEGGSGDVSLSFLRTFADKKAREEIADKYLRDGKISGEEYLDIVSDYNLELFGIEDPVLYDTNLDSFLNIEGYKDQGLKDTDNLRDAVEALKPHMYNPQLLQLDEKKVKFEKKSLSLTDYCAYLQELAGQKGVTLEAYKQLKSFRESSALEKTIDFKQAEAERGLFIKELAKKLEAPAVKELIAKTRDFKDKKLSAQEFYAILRQLSQDKLDVKANFQQFDAYMRYVSMGKNIDAEALIKEIVSLESQVRGSLFVNNDERRLSEISHIVDMLVRFLKLDLTPAEYDSMQATRSDYMTVSLVNFLTDNCRKYQLSIRPEVSGIIDENFEKLDSFYRVGIDRELAFLKNIKQKIGSSKDSFAVVITGGFHTAGLSKMFQQQGYSYAVVTPSISKKGDPDVYFSILRQDKEILPDYSGTDSDY